MEEKLTLGIKFDINKDKVEFYGNINEDGMEAIITNWIQGQIGKGKDNTPANQRDVYNIEIDWYPEDDRLVCRHNCGNKGLREGILMRVLQDL